MAQQAAGSGGNSSNSCSNSGDVGRVFRAVAQGETAARVRELIDEYATSGSARTRRSDEARRSAVVNHKSSADGAGETSLEAAHDRECGDVVGALLENGADATALGPNCSALALAIHYDQAETLRALLRSGRHRVNEVLWYGIWSDVRGGYPTGPLGCAVHLAVVPPMTSPASDPPPPRLAALEVLVREFGADVDARDDEGRAPLYWTVFAAPGHRERAVDALVRLGADVETRDNYGWTPIFEAASKDASLVLRLLSLGASANVLNISGFSPFVIACRADEPTARVAVLALLRASSRETRRAVDRKGASAIDRLVTRVYAAEDWCKDVMCELLSSGASVKPRNAARVLPIASRHGARLEAEVATREHDPPPWQMHEAMVELAFDFLDVRAVEEGVAVRERRVRELEDALRARGEGSDESG